MSINGTNGSEVTTGAATEYSIGAVQSEVIQRRCCIEGGSSPVNGETTPALQPLGPSVSRVRREGKAQLMLRMTDKPVGPEPSRRDLAAIEAEWPRIAADLALLDAEIRALRSVDELTMRRARRSVRRVLGAPLRFGGGAA